MLIALIDDGINITVFPELNLRYDLSVEVDGTIKERHTSESIMTEHGTTCARIIAKYAPDAEFCSLRIFHNEKLRTSCTQLVAALKWCLNVRIPLIHMSVGSSLLSDYQKIRSITAKILHQRQVLVAARSNNQPYSIPACLSGVLGVLADDRYIDDEYKIVFSDSGQPTIQASSWHKLFSLAAGETTTQITNSYAAPTVTAKVHNLLSNIEPFSISPLQVFRMLSNSEVNPQYISPDFIENAIIYNPYGYPLNKSHFFFTDIQEESKPSIKSRRYDIVYLAPPRVRSFDPIWFDLQGNKHLCENILFGGKTQPSTLQMQSENFFWSEDAVHNLQYQSRVLPSSMDCPIINIYGVDRMAIDLLCELRDLFFTDGFQCGCLSDHPFSYLYGVGFVAKEDRWQRAIENAMFLYDPDVLINCFQKEASQLPPPEQEEFRIIIENVDESKKMVSLVANVVAFPRGFTEGDILALYQKISRYFS